MRAHTRSVDTSSKPPFIVPVAPIRGMIAPDIDRILSELARAGDRHDPELRNALFTAYAPRLHRILQRYWYRNLQAFGCELVDLEQEMFLIFEQLLGNWTGNGSLSAYLHGAFPWRLFDAARRMASCDRVLSERAVVALKQDESFAAQEAAVLLEELAAALSPFDRSLLLRHVRDGESIAAIAHASGANPRTLRRAWVRLQRHLQESLTNR